MDTSEVLIICNKDNFVYWKKKKKKLHSADLHDAATNETSLSNLPLTGRMYSDMLDLINKQLLKLQN